jgi:acetylserotonin N-methyltransferase
MSRTQGDKRVYDAYIAGRQSAALAAAVRVGLFDLLDAGPLAPDAIAARLGVSPRGARILVRVLGAMGFLAVEDGRAALADDAREFLVRGRPEWLGGLIDLEIESFLTPERVLEALASGGASVYGAEDPWRRHALDPESARAFTAAMHSISARPAAALAREPELAQARRLLDVGGGSGAISIALARAWPDLRCTVWDLESVCALAREYVAAAGLSARVASLAGDMFGDPVPRDHDVHLYSQILHDWPPEACRRLLERSFAALPSGGRVLVHEKLVGPGAPLANALVDLDMLVWTEGQQWDFAGLRALLESVGFRDTALRETTGYWSAVWARKP